MKFLRHSNSLIICSTLNYINLHLVFSEENNIFNFYIITSKTNTPKKIRNIFLSCVLSKIVKYK